MSISRRRFLNAAPAVLIPVVWPSTQAPPVTQVPQSFPAHPADLVRDMVGASHGNIARVKELLARHPTLVRASWDWGFGDWEDAVGAASHVGNREIAELLILNGARPTIFSAAMFGQIDVVRAFVQASPGIEATPGPHGITLLRHAMAGGPGSQAVVEYLKTLPGADARAAVQPISQEELAAIAGTYVFGAAADQQIVIALATSNSNNRNTLTFTRPGASARGLTHVGDRVFFPIGAPKVQIRFRATPGGTTLTVQDGALTVEATRR
jgi:hypothetical protein